MGKRIEYIDAAKAIGILLVILGHNFTNTIPYLGAAIYSFHMPLFFIISGMFLKPIGFKDGVVKYGKAYLKPYFITCLLMLLATFILYIFRVVDYGEIFLGLKRIAFGSGSNETNALFHDYPIVGPIWFLLALFWGCLFTSIIKKFSSSLVFSILVTFVLFFIGYVSSKYLRIPLSLQMGMCSVPFIMVGGILKQYDIVERFGEINKFYVIALVAIWGVAILVIGNALNMASCRYDEGIITVPLSIIASVLVLYLCKKWGFVGIDSLKYLGKNTLYVLAGHQLVIYCIKTSDLDVKGLCQIIPPPHIQ